LDQKSSLQGGREVKINGVDCVFHHTGIPTSVPRPDERYSKKTGMYTSDADARLLRVQWHRFDTDSPLHELIRTVPHVAFKVTDLETAIQGHKPLLGPYEPIQGFRVAIIADGSIPIELIQTDLSDEEIWAKSHTENILYRG
jgi:hypothetical protein